MNFMHWKISGKSGDIIKVTMDEPAYVRLLDPLNFEAYRQGKHFEGEGGWSDQSRAEFILPYKGIFHLVIDLHGKSGDVKVGVDIARA